MNTPTIGEDVKPEDYKLFADILYKESGLALTPEKTYLLESRLLSVAQKFKLANLEEIAQKLRSGNDNALKYAVVEAMTTNETMFFRDKAPFDRLKNDLLPFFIKARANKKSLRIWSAACSSGQEPYSIAMILRETPQLQGWKHEIIATDISKEILTEARNGVYSQFQVQRGLPIQMLMKYFTKQGEQWTINQDIKDMIKFQEANLLSSLDYLGQFDMIFCRNVLIYFDMETKAKVLAGLRKNLQQDGTLMLGGAETVIGISTNFKPHADLRGIYVPTDSTFQHSMSGT